jgi:hypothetical protein
VSVLTRKILPSFFGIATIGWIIGGTIWVDKQLSKSQSEVFSNSSATNSSFVTKSNVIPRSICFNSGSAIPIFYNENILDLRKTVDFLLKNNQQSLVLTGLSDVKEQSNSGTNLGFARAEAIKKTLVNFGAPNNSLEILSEQRNNLIDANNKVCDAVKMRFVSNNDSRFQALNLFYKSNKYRFVETEELREYFDTLKVFLEKNPSAKLKIAAHCSDTEGSKMSKNRLGFLTDLLQNKGFDFKQFHFEDKKTKGNAIAISDTQNIVNQCIEIRILTP